MANNDAIIEQLERTNRLLAQLLVTGRDQTEAMQQLWRIGYSYSEIGSLLGLTRNAVELRLRRIKKKSKRR